MPTDSENRCAVSVHYYTPSTFCIIEEDVSWGKAQSEWGSEEDVAFLKENLDKLKTTFIDKGIPVIIGEYGAAHGRNAHGALFEPHLRNHLGHQIVHRAVAATRTIVHHVIGQEFRSAVDPVFLFDFNFRHTFTF